MPFPKAEPGVQMRGKVGDELWSARLVLVQAPEERRRGEREMYSGILRCQGHAGWSCPHVHKTTREARLCAADELARRQGRISEPPYTIEEITVVRYQGICALLPVGRRAERRALVGCRSDAPPPAE